MPEVLPQAVVIGDAVLYQDLEDEVVLLNMDDQQYYGLNDVGAAMWKCLIDLGNLEKAENRICENYDAEKAAVRADLEEFVRQLISAGLLKAA